MINGNDVRQWTLVERESRRIFLQLTITLDGTFAFKFFRKQTVFVKQTKKKFVFRLFLIRLI